MGTPSVHEILMDEVERHPYLTGPRGTTVSPKGTSHKGAGEIIRPAMTKYPTPMCGAFPQRYETRAITREHETDPKVTHEVCTGTGPRNPHDPSSAMTMMMPQNRNWYHSGPTERQSPHNVCAATGASTGTMGVHEHGKQPPGLLCPLRRPQEWSTQRTTEQRDPETRNPCNEAREF